MVMKIEHYNMSSEQPLKKKLRIREQDESPEENNGTNLLRSDLSTLLPTLTSPIENEEFILNTVNSQLSEKNELYRTNSYGSEIDNDISVCERSKISHCEKFINSIPYMTNSDNTSIEPARNIINSSKGIQNLGVSYIDSGVLSKLPLDCNFSVKCTKLYELNHFQEQLIKHCLCGISLDALINLFDGKESNNLGCKTMLLSEWDKKDTLKFLSHLLLLFDVYIKQNNRGVLCSKIALLCETVIQNEYNLIEQIIALCDGQDQYINFLAARTLSTFLIIAKTKINNEWLETIINFLTVENLDYIKINFALEVIKRVVEWKDVETHVLEESESMDIPSSSQQAEMNINCQTISYTDAESYDTSSIKRLVIKCLESKWPELIQKIQSLLNNNSSLQSQTCVLTFLALWESTISVKANLSVVETKPFYAHLELFVRMLTNNLSPIICKQLLSLFNEVLCYGSTLALQDMLPEDTCQLAHLIVRYVKDYRLLDNLPFQREECYTINSFVGAIFRTQPEHSNTDKTILQKMVLLVLKSVAITIKETRSDSSDSSVGSEDFDFYQDMQLIERSIRDVLKKVDAFIKNSLEYHPEASFSKILVRLFNDQDDYMIEALVCTLDISVGISYRNAIFPDLVSMLNPFLSFMEFLNIVSHDSDVLLDYLISNETCFLLYLLKFLKYIKRNWSQFLNTCRENTDSRGNELENTMTVLIRLKMQISRLVSQDLFPYNIGPIVRLLEVCENLYEGNECS